MSKVLKFPVTDHIRAHLGFSNVPFGEHVSVLEDAYKKWEGMVRDQYRQLCQAEQHALTVLFCLTHPDHKQKHFEVNHPIASRKRKLLDVLEREDVTIFGKWLFAIAVLVLLAAISAHAQKGTSRIDVITVQHSDNSPVKTFAAPFTVKEGANTTFSIGTCPGTDCGKLFVASAAGAGGTPCTTTASSVQYNNAGGFGCISTMTTDGTIVTAKVGADWLFVDPTDASKKFSFDASNIATSTTRTVNIPNANSTTVQSDTGASNNFLTAISVQGVISKAQPAFTNLSGSAACSQMPALTGDVTTSAGACATTNVNLPDGVTQAGSLVVTDIAAPTSPSAAHLKVFGDSTDLRFHDKNAAGTIGTTVVADTGAANNYISAISAAGVITKSRPACATLSDSGAFCNGTAYASLTGVPSTFTPTAHNLLSASHGDTVAASPVRGDIIIANSTPAWTKLALGAATSGKYAKSNGTDVVISSGSASGTGACSASQWASTLNADAAPSCTQPAFTDISGSVAAGQMPALTGAVTTSAGAVATSPGKIDVLNSSAFCQAAGASSTTYTCNLSPAITAYVTGTHYRFKADVANTAASTINFNGQGAKTIKKAAGGITTDIAANDMQAGQWVDLVYDGTNMQMQSTLGNASAGSGTVTSIATTSPITGGTITTTGTIACATCVVATVNPGAGVGHFAGSTQTETSSAVVQGDVTNGYVDLSSNQAVAGNKVISGTTTAENLANLFLFDNVVWGAGYGMVCDGATDDTTALANALSAASSTKNAHVILPPGTCIVTVAGSFNIPDNVWISGAGKFATIVKRGNGVNSGTSILNLFQTASNITMSDFTLDGNRANQTAGADLVNFGSSSKLTFQRMRFINSWANGLGGFPAGGSFSADTLITNNDFENNGRAACTSANCSAIQLQRPLRVRVIGNRSDTDSNFVSFSSDVGAGQFIVSDNVVKDCTNFAVAFGGGTIGAANGTVANNIFNCSTSIQNIVDLAYWTDVAITNNTIIMGTAFSGISDLPPANRVTITGNRIQGNAAGPGTASCIGMGGSNITITGNVCNGTGGAGIVLSVGATSQSTGIIVAGNEIKNTSQNTAGQHAGIEVFLASGGTASLSGVLISGNHSYDDQGTKTQGYGIGITLSGQTTGLSNLTVEQNDVRGNKNDYDGQSGLKNSATSTVGFNIYDNQGGNDGSTTPSQSISSSIVAAVNLPGAMTAPILAPVLACSNSGGSLAAATHFFKFTFNNTASGETTVSPESSCATTGASGSVVVTAPTLPRNASGYTVYDANTTNTEKQQAASAACVNISTTCTVTVLAAGASPPGANTASAAGTSTTANAGDVGLISSNGTINNNIEVHTPSPGVAGGLVLYDPGGTNTITHTTSGTVTSYTVNHPLAAATGVLTGVNSSNVITWAHSGDAAHSLSQLAKTAAVTTFTLCAATANTACGQAGQYRISYNFYGSGTACATVTAGSVGLNLTWTDTNAVAHTTISLPLWDQKSAAMTNGLFNFNTALGTEGASGSYIISTNGTIIQAATTYTACTSGTGTYNLKMTVEQLQ